MASTTAAMDLTTAISNETQLLPNVIIDAADIAVIAIYFVLVLAVGVWVSKTCFSSIS